jgi:hypothetical protein
MRRLWGMAKRVAWVERSETHAIEHRYAALAFAVGIFTTTFRSARSACQRS